jgi:hypothetical protein
VRKRKRDRRSGMDRRVGPDVDLDNVKVLFRRNEKIDAQMDGWKTGLPPFIGGSPEERLTGRFAFAGG